MSRNDTWSTILLLSCFLQAGLVFGTLRSFGVFFPELVVYFDSASSSVSWVTSCGVAVQQLMSPLGCALSSRFGFRPVIVLGGLLASLGMFCASFAKSLYQLYLCIGVMSGLGWAFIFSPSMAAVTQYFSRRRSLATGFVLTGVGTLSFALSPLLQYLIEMFSWRGAMLLLSGLALHSVPCGALLRCASWETPGETREFLWGWELLGNWPFLRYCLAVTLINAGYFVPYAHLVAHMQAKGAGERPAALIMSLVGVADVVGRLFAGWLSDLIPKRILLLLSMWTGVTAVVQALLPLANGLVEMGVAAVAFGFCAGALTPGVFSALPGVVGEKKVLPALGLLQMVESVGGLVGAPISGWLRDWTGNFSLSFAISGSFLLMGSLILITLPGFCFRNWLDTDQTNNLKNLPTSNSMNKSRSMSMTSKDRDSSDCPKWAMITTSKDLESSNCTERAITRTNMDCNSPDCTERAITSTSKDRNSLYCTEQAITRTSKDWNSPDCTKRSITRTSTEWNSPDCTEGAITRTTTDQYSPDCTKRAITRTSKDCNSPDCTERTISKTEKDLSSDGIVITMSSMEKDLNPPDSTVETMSRTDKIMSRRDSTDHAMNRTIKDLLPSPSTEQFKSWTDDNLTPNECTCLLNNRTIMTIFSQTDTSIEIHNHGLIQCSLTA
ncbi:monocarboxylate transporter 13-like [Pelobates fuscus]|uniref:monocarboxylate transporter 13-like n=1 Tax=Pelobates fuscus TaxID=191477 RepID=UPI002FE4CC2F